MVEGNHMKQLSILVLTFAIGTLGNSSYAQSNASPANASPANGSAAEGYPTTKSKPSAQVQKANPKVKTNPEKGKKTTSSEDAAYAAAYKKGIPSGQASPPK
jgi:hypothetical protein